MLHSPYEVEKARLVVKEVVDSLALDLVGKHLVTDQLVLTVGYDIESLSPERGYTGQVITDSYGRQLLQHAYGQSGPVHIFQQADGTCCSGAF